MCMCGLHQRNGPPPASCRKDQQGCVYVCVCVGLCICLDISAGPEPNYRAYQMSLAAQRQASQGTCTGAETCVRRLSMS